MRNQMGIRMTSFPAPSSTSSAAESPFQSNERKKLLIHPSTPWGSLLSASTLALLLPRLLIPSLPIVLVAGHHAPVGQTGQEAGAGSTVHPAARRLNKQKQRLLLRECVCVSVRLYTGVKTFKKYFAQCALRTNKKLRMPAFAAARPPCPATDPRAARLCRPR